MIIYLAIIFLILPLQQKLVLNGMMSIRRPMVLLNLSFFRRTLSQLNVFTAN